MVTGDELGTGVGVGVGVGDVESPEHANKSVHAAATVATV